MQTYPCSRVLLRFDRDTNEPDLFRCHLSACAQDREGNLWLGNDESTGLSRLKSKTPDVFAKHLYQDLSDRLELPEEDEEIDIEGMDIEEDRLWIVGSHTGTRKKFKPKKDIEDNLERLSQVRLRPNRFLIASAQIDGGKLKDDRLTQIPITKEGNALSLALQEDPHLGPFLGTKGEEQHGGCQQIASKENGFDIEGVAVREDRLFLGLRGPVLRGWAILLEICLVESTGNRLTLEPIGSDGRHYRKHFIDLKGMGVRELMWYGSDLLILAGPTMDITGLQSIYRLRYAADLTDDSITALDDGRLELLYHLPLMTHGDKAEGLCRYGDSGLLVVYDAPRSDRLVAKNAILADVFAPPDA
ncbi:DUF3616 domain-containing protein [Candidatus Thiosymbion oneisti]|nr:DUF3616 domain-containing protein [Candidatus Thiosymbion oneisti]